MFLFLHAVPLERYFSFFLFLSRSRLLYRSIIIELPLALSLSLSAQCPFAHAVLTMQLYIYTYATTMNRNLFFDMHLSVQMEKTLAKMHMVLFVQIFGSHPN